MTVAELKNKTDSPRIRVNGRVSETSETILTPEALRFVADLERRFGQRRKQLLGLRSDRQARFNQGEQPDFRPETAEIRAAEWRVKQAPSDLQDRRVEITGPTDRQTIAGALYSGAKCFMADFEDGHAPDWSATIEGQVNLYDAIRGPLNRAGAEKRATLMIRPRGWHLEERHLEIEGHPVSASLFDFGLYIYHNAYELLEQNSGPYLYLPKLESYIEAQLWADVFDYAEESLGLNHGSICCSVLIETVPAVFEMDEILYTLRDYVVGLNCGRWDYTFSLIKRFQANPNMLLPERNQITTESGFLHACSQLMIKTCHRRGAHAIGGLATEMPVTDDPTADADIKMKVRKEKAREATAGHDGTWVIHPELVPEAMAAFDLLMPEPNQIKRQLSQLEITAEELLCIPAGNITLPGLNSTISIALRYLAAWLSGHGSVLINHLMEDTATAEIARSQLWQWTRHPKGVLDDGRKITFELVNEGVEKELKKIRQEIGQEAYDEGHFEQAAGLLNDIIANDHFVEFLTLPASKMLA
ncbi:MAG: malate synthase A [Sedimenticola sp.]|nr:malate synthase A [Sedimenticola sp.]